MCGTIRHCEPGPENPSEEMLVKPTLTKITLTSKNDSIAPEYREEVTLRLEASHSEEVKKAMDRVMNETMVNSTMSLADFVALQRAGDEKALAELKEKTPPQPKTDDGVQPTGGGTSEWVLSGPGGEIKMPDGYHYSRVPLIDLEELLKTKGERSVWKPEPKEGVTGGGTSGPIADEDPDLKPPDIPTKN
jgi:hypothetical protein